MILEIMGVRLLAPWFGQSQLVWTNVIGVVLAALACGQWLGGRWAESRRGVGPVALLLAAGSLALVLPELVRWLAPRMLPGDLRLVEAYPLITAGSLLVSLLVLTVPMAALGAVAPWLVRLSKGAGEQPGRVAGIILGAGTVGSLLGVFGATHVLLGWVGSAGAVRVAGAVLLLAALALGRAAGRCNGRALAWLLIPAVALWLPAPVSSALETVETAYQVARVDEAPDGTRLLRINEALDSFHSVWVPGALLTGRYFDAFLVPALAAPPDPSGKRRVMIVGLGGGTMARQILAVDPSIEVTGVELDADLVRLGRRWFGLPEATRVIEGVDGRLALRHARSVFGAILVDAYASQIYLPAHLCTVEFFELLRSRLLPSGVAALNLGGLQRADPVVAAVSATFAAVFDGATLARVPGTRNMILLGWNGAPASRQYARARLEAAGLAQDLRWMIDGRGFATIRTGTAELLHDGDSPVESLAHESWRGLP